MRVFTVPNLFTIFFLSFFLHFSLLLLFESYDFPCLKGVTFRGAFYGEEEAQESQLVQIQDQGCSEVFPLVIRLLFVLETSVLLFLLENHLHLEIWGKPA